MIKLLTAAAWMLVLSALVGCIILPLPIPPSGKTGEVTGRLRVGYSTRADAHALLGAPNRLATPQHEVWELKRDPFSVFVVSGGVSLFGGYGAGAESVPFGRPTWSRVAIEYDPQGKVASWHWEGPVPDSSQDEQSPRDTAHGTSKPVPEPPRPAEVLAWTAESFALSQDGARAALLDAQAGRKQIEIVELPTGRRSTESPEWPEACGAAAISLGFGGMHVYSAPRNPEPGEGLCRWQVDAGTLSAERVSSSELAKELDQARVVRLIGSFIVIGRVDGEVFVWNPSSDTGTTLPPTEQGYVATRASVGADGTMLAIELAGGANGPPEILLHDLATGARRTLALPGPARAVAALALTPEGDGLAAHRRTHIEVWRLGRPEDPPTLEAVLLPASSTTRAALAFSDDGHRLVAASSYAQVWDRRSWLEIGRAPPGFFWSALTPSHEIEISPDGSYIATRSGLWRIAPEPPLESASLRAPANRKVATQPPQQGIGWGAAGQLPAMARSLIPCQTGRKS